MADRWVECTFTERVAVEQQHFIRMTRRTVVGGIAAMLPSTVLGQTSQRLRRVAVLRGQSESDPTHIKAQFAESLRELGWIEGQNLQIENRFASGKANLFRDYAAAIVASAPDVIVAESPLAVLSVQQLTKTIPIVFVSVGDPVGYGFIESMARPGGNVTGIANFGFAMGSKWVEILREVAPKITRAAFLYHPATTTKGYDFYFQSVAAAASRFSIDVIKMPLEGEADIERVILDFARTPDGGLIVPPDPFTIEHRAKIIDAAGRQRLPAVYAFGFFVESGGLVSYSVDVMEQVEKSAYFTDRILRGQRPADLPAQDPTKFETAINLKTARALGLVIPPTLLARADKVVE